MIPALDSSAFLPDDAGLRQAAAEGIKLWAGYFDGPGIWVGWPDSNFQRIKAAGMQSLAFCSGWSDPAACRARADRLGIHFGVDVEYGIRVDGGWVQQWLTDSGRGGLYGGSGVHPGRTAEWHIISDYPRSGDPGATWPAYRPRPKGNLGWQWAGSVSMYGGSVDRSWLDDWFGHTTTPEVDMTPEQAAQLQEVWNATRSPHATMGDIWDAVAAIKAAQGGGGLTDADRKLIKDLTDAITKTFKAAP